MYHWSRRLQAMFQTRETWLRVQKCVKPIPPRRPFCSKATDTNPNTVHSNSAETNMSTYNESLKKLDKMDFLTAAKMLFTEPPKKKKFGLDFHLVQLFFACMPSLAVYLVAQYARYDMRKMEAELEQKKKKEEEKTEEIVLNATKEKEAGSVPELLEVRERLEKLEETVKGIAAETKKQMANSQAKGHEGDSEKKSFGTEANSESSKPVGKDPLKQDSAEPRPALGKDRLNGSAQVSNASQEGKIQDGRGSRDAKR